MNIRVSLFLATLTLSSVTLGLPALANADAGVFTGNGQDLHQITSKTVQLVSIDVTIILGRGPFLFDGTVPGMDRAEYECSFALRNLSEKEEEVQIGFPVDSEFARLSEDDNSDPSKWVAGLRLHRPRREGGKRFESSFPVHHPWWFRQIKPSGWKEVKQGLQWTYKDFKPKVPVEIAYYMTQVPQVPDEVDPFLNRFLEELKPGESPITELNHLKQMTYVSKAFALQQRWCPPNKDSSLDRLSETQRAVLKKIEARIQSSAVGK